MLLELITTYKKRYEEELYENRKVQEFNNNIQHYIDSLSNEDKFTNLDIDNFLNFLQEIKYSSYPFDKVKTTLIYIKRNNLFYDKSCKTFFEDLIKELNYAKKISNNQNQDLESQVLEINKLLNCILNKKFIEVNFVIQLIKDANKNKEEIFKLMLEINSHNLQILNTIKEKSDVLKQKIEEKNDIKNVENLSNLELITKYNYKLEFTDIEKTIIERESLNNLREKLQFLSSLQFSFLKKARYKQLLVVLLGYTSLENIKEITKISNEQDIPLEEILPTFYLNIDFKADTVEDEFYQNLQGSFECFKEVIKTFSSSIKASKLITEFSTVCMTDYEKLVLNIDVLKEYKIPLSTFSIKCLTIDNLRDKIDKFIEAGLYEYIKNIPAILLNEDDALFYRLYYAKKNNIQIKRRFLYRDITDVDGLGINKDNYKEKVDVYKPKHITSTFYQDLLDKETKEMDFKNDEFISLLSEYEVDDFVYNINGILVSKLKVIRLYENYIHDMCEMSGYKNGLDTNYCIRGIIFSVISDLILDYKDTKKVILELLKTYIKYYDLDKEYLDVLCENFGILDEDKTNLLNQSKRNGVN